MFLSNGYRPQRNRSVKDFSKKPPPHLSNIMPSLDFELELVGKINEDIDYVAKQLLNY